MSSTAKSLLSMISKLMIQNSSLTTIVKMLSDECHRTLLMRTFVQTMAWSHQITSHYLNQYLPRCILSYMASLGHNEFIPIVYSTKLLPWHMLTCHYWDHKGCILMHFVEKLPKTMTEKCVWNVFSNGQHLPHRINEFIFAHRCALEAPHLAARVTYCLKIGYPGAFWVTGCHGTRVSVVCNIDHYELTCYFNTMCPRDVLWGRFWSNLVEVLVWFHHYFKQCCLLLTIWPLWNLKLPY